MHALSLKKTNIHYHLFEVAYASYKLAKLVQLESLNLILLGFA